MTGHDPSPAHAVGRGSRDMGFSPHFLSTASLVAACRLMKAAERRRAAHAAASETAAFAAKAATVPAAAAAEMATAAATAATAATVAAAAASTRPGAPSRRLPTRCHMRAPPPSPGAPLPHVFCGRHRWRKRQRRRHHWRRERRRCGGNPPDRADTTPRHEPGTGREQSRNTPLGG